MATRTDDRLFNTNGRRHFRRSYSLVEVRYSLLVLVVLLSIGGWVVWKGAHPDPELLALETTLLDEGTAEAPERARKLATGTAPGASAAGERGPVPDGLAAPGWRERDLAVFERDDLYVKINGRAGYYESFGVQRLHFITLLSEADESLAVDIEMYDQGNVANALGAYAGERQPDAAPELDDGTIGHTSRNAMFLVRGRFYVRAIGADESEPVMTQLAHLRRVLAAGLPAEPLPWAYGLFVGAGADPGKIGFQPENAFSFGFARNVYTVLIDDEGAELFAVATADEAGAGPLAQQFRDGFKSYGKDAGSSAGGPLGEVAWIEDQYLSTIAGVTTVGPLVVGVRGMADQAQAEAALTALTEAAKALPDEVRAQARAEANAPPPNPAGGYGEPEADDDDDEPAQAEPDYGAEPGQAEPDYGAEPGQAEPDYGAE
ncbi:DUF6599 family protein, partial [Haliangium sp.]